ncbi:hypothetical protein TNCV_3170491 [Trichonephila clavipes]|nr:hypothetical protein TNCV_3170491 [Trichonephila clavipes]
MYNIFRDAVISLFGWFLGGDDGDHLENVMVRYTPEYLSSQAPSAGMPPVELNLKLGCIVMYRSLSCITFQDGDRFNSCQVIYSQFGLAILKNDHQARRRFVEWAQNEIAVVPDFHKRILFSDEAHFWLNGYVNKQNCRI